MIFLAVFVVAMTVTMGLIMLLKQYAVQLQFIDMPDERKVHTQAVPRIGGLGMVVGTLLPLFLWLDMQGPQVGIAAAIAVLLFFGVWDDRKELSYKVKFLGQILAALIAVFYGEVCIKWLPFISSFSLPHYLGAALTVFVLVAITNAMNLVDGLDGLAGGTTMLAFALLAFLAYLAGDSSIVMIAVAVMGAVLGFLRFNSHPASIFMGDCGSQFLGFVVALLAIKLTQNADVGLASSLPIVILGLPIFDTLMVMFIRIKQGKSPFIADKNHIHHRLLASGLDHYEVVFVLYFLQSLLMIMAFSGRYQSDYWLLGFYFSFCALLSLGLFFLQHYKLPKWFERQHLELDSSAKWQAHYIVTIGYYLCCATLLLALLGFVFTSHYLSVMPSVDVFVLSIVLLGLLLWQACKQAQITLLDQFSLYTLLSLSLYFCLDIFNAYPALLDSAKIGFSAAFFILLLAFQLNKNDRFEVSTLDFLIVFLCFSLPYLPYFGIQNTLYAQMIMWLVILFYLLEYLLSIVPANWHQQLRLAIIGLHSVCITLLFFS